MGGLLVRLLGFSGSGPGLAVIALAWVLSMGVVGYKAYSLGEDHVQVQVLQQKELIHQAITEAGGELSIKFGSIMSDYLKDNQIIKEIHDKTIVKIPTYITKEADSKCTINNGFVELHNSAAENRPLNPPDQVTNNDSGTKLSEVAGVVVSNYAACNANEAKLVALQEEVKAYQAKLKELQDKSKPWKFGDLFK